MDAKRAACALALALAIPLSGVSQEQKARQEQPIKLATDLVTLTATVFDGQGRYVANLM